MLIKLNLMAAVCENMGIGKNNDLPWRLRTEMEYFTRMTSATTSPNKKNIVIMGRRTWDSIPSKFKPLPNRINFVLSRSGVDLNGYGDTFAFGSLEQALNKLRSPDLIDTYENIWVIGGSQVYKETMHSKHFHRLYLTKIMQNFDCDTFFPPLICSLVEIKDPDVPEGVQVENGVRFEYKVYELGPEE